MAKQKAFLFNQERCIGCKACVVACKVKNNIEVGINWRNVDSFEVESKDKYVEKFLSYACMHCEDPQCLQACPTNSYTKREDGIVTHNQETCVGCGYCIYACPYNAPKMNLSTKKIEKCNMCSDLVDKGEDPACVSGCPVQVLEFRNLDEVDLQNVEKVAEGFPYFSCKPSMRFVNSSK